MSKGKRYEEPKLNVRKVVAVVLAILVVIMSIVVIKGIFTSDNSSSVTSNTYFAVYENNKWGVINQNGETVINPSYEEMIIIPDSKTDIFLCTYNVDYDTGEYSCKALNSSNEEIFTEYSKIEAISNLDENNDLWYESNVLKFESDGKWGLIDFNGNVILSADYDSITALQGMEDAILIEKDGLYGLVNDEGKIMLTTQYKSITNLGTSSSDGYIVQDSETDLYGIVSSSDKEILASEYDSIEKVYGNGMYVVNEDDEQKLINSNGEDVLTSGFDQIAGILKTTDKGVIFVKNNFYGIMDMTGTVLVDAEYDNLVETESNVFIATKDENQGIIDIDGNVKLAFNYQTITYSSTANLYFAENETYNCDVMNTSMEINQSGILIELNESSGYFELRQNDEYKYYNFKFEEQDVTKILSNNTLYLSKKDGLYGYVDKEGNVVVDYIYDDAKEQNSYGYAAVKKDGVWGAIDSTGQVVIEPTYDLDGYLLVDFIGQWHLGKDLNMNYYNKQ